MKYLKDMLPDLQSAHGMHRLNETVVLKVLSETHCLHALDKGDL